MRSEAPGVTEDAQYIAGGHFALTGDYAEILLYSLPPIVHIRRELDKAAIRWSQGLCKLPRDKFLSVLASVDEYQPHAWETRMWVK